VSLRPHGGVFLKIVGFEIENYRSISKTHATKLESLVVLIGKNSSGKSNVLEGLASAFQFFDIAGGNTPGIDDYVFYERRSRSPARFTVTLELSEDELSKAFPDEWVRFQRELLSVPTPDPNFGLNRLTFTRELSSPGGNWTTPRLVWGAIPLVEAGIQATPEVVERALKARGARPAAPPTTGAGPAPLKPPSLESATSGPIVPTSVAPVAPVFTPPTITSALGEIAKLIKGRFKLISIARDVKTPGVLRETVVDVAVQNQLWTLDQSTKPEDEAALERVDRAFQRITGERLDLVQAKAYVKKSAGRIPLTLEGGGIQSSLNLTATLFTAREPLTIYALEEPEGHAHPELQRQLFAAIRELAESAQVFIATHSPIFVDRTGSSSLILVKNTPEGTKLESSGEYVQALQEIGARPSDLFFASKVLLVEGPSDEIVVPAIARGSGIDFSDVQVVQTGGKSGARSRADLLLRFAKDMVTPFVLFDNDGSADQRKLVSERLVKPENIRVLSQGTIEDYYPTGLVEKAAASLDERYDLGVTRSDAWKKWHAHELSLAKINLGSKSVEVGGGWKVVLARELAPLLAADSSAVPDELIRFLKVVAGPR
jgi:predicted ATPase